MNNKECKNKRKKQNCFVCFEVLSMKKKYNFKCCAPTKVKFKKNRKFICEKCFIKLPGWVFCSCSCCNGEWSLKCPLCRKRVKISQEILKKFLRYNLSHESFDTIFDLITTMFFNDRLDDIISDTDNTF